MNVEHIASRFESAFPGSAPAGFCQVPGRVNLIGEHIDYNGLSVLPMAIDRHIWAAFKPRDDGQIHVASDDSRYPSASFPVSDSIEPAKSGDWSNYGRAAVQSMYTEFGIDTGMDCIFVSDLPAAAGLSSSTALVVASAMAYGACGGRPVDDENRKPIAELLALGERYVGTRSGGMDHAAILLGQQGHALKIDFNPLRCEPVPIPEDCAIVVCNSGTVADKGGSSQTSYNRGPALSAVIRAMVERYAQQEFGDEIELSTLGEIWHGPLCLTHKEAAELIEGAITKARYTVSAIAKYLELTPAQVRKQWLGEVTEPRGGFPLQAWARHQYQEPLRVERMRDAMLCNDAENAGRLMRESHASCAKALGVSTPELDALVDISIANGAYGARLTGAGFGGCTVNLVPRDRIGTFLDAVWTGYYIDGSGQGAGFKRSADAIFEVAASDGAAYP